MSATKKQLDQMEARVLRKVAAALRGAHSEGYSSMGPQDGDSYPASFDAPVAGHQRERRSVLPSDHHGRVR